jgi:sulfite reductase (NADPH) hemoprotein beta-component
MTKLSPNEAIKTKSRGLRGDMAEGLRDQLTGALSPDDQQLLKFHGTYQQDDRDRREERERKKLEPAYSYMVRLRIPGGDITAEQWLGLQDAADTHANGIIKITTRQTVQFHGIVKSQMKPSMQWFDRLGLDAIAACGDVNRNVVAGANPALSPFHKQVHDFAAAISEHLLPKTGAYKEIWLDGEKLEGSEPEEDPLYLKHYLPRKFKIGIAIPPHNEADVYIQDIGLIAVEENGKFTGFNVAIGGGLGCTHGNAATYPRLATTIGFVPKDKTLDACWQIVATQRDHGNREDRKLSRLKYTVDRMGVDVFKAEVEKRMGVAFEPARPAIFMHRGDVHEWVQDAEGLWYLTLFVENGRVRDLADYPIKSGLKALAATGKLGLRFTANQNVMITRIAENDKKAIEAILKEYKLYRFAESLTLIRQESLACVALPTCPLALAEAQRYLPDLLTKIEAVMDKHSIKGEEVSIRMTGCPNGCARPYVAEIGLIGKSMGHYNLHIGGDRMGERLNTLYKEDMDEAGILATLDHLFGDFRLKRLGTESFGDFAQREYIVA